ncbi:MAG: tRNA (N6-isopentenyl adenosine(37)-C2)-methylthiotransferase MiaB [Ruminococcaceae bacterium]|nr:tRNA (N6-isopentenyl adenosine(37)-C2)-methylthiotransferase MiaB [Oscillospiraceae bacterium]
MSQQTVYDASQYIEKLRGYTASLAAEQGSAPKCFVLTFGCQQNVADSEKLSGMARDMGYELCDDPADADLIAVNTCAIREHAEQKALSIVGQYKHLKAKKPSLIIAVCGCMVAQEHRREDIKHKYPYVDLTFGTASLHRFPELLWQKISRSRRIFCPEETEYTVAEGVPICRESNYRAWVSIMYGCNNFCSYCIVPYVRGRERSREMHEVVAEVKDLVARGYKDITLLGQNVNSYAKGMGYDFADLLCELDKIEGDFILRFMTSHPKDASYKLIDVMANSKHIAHQFHLPLQSGSDKILKAMNRHYDKARYLDIVRYIREKMPDAALSSDIIVGFPGETDEDFEDTMQILDTVRFDMLFSFIYSPRKGTPAAEMEQVDAKITGKRFDRLLALQHDIALEKNQPMVGKTIRVLCDGPSKNNPEIYSGREEGNKIVFFHASPEDTGKFVSVKIDKADAFALWGEIEK